MWENDRGNQLVETWNNTLHKFQGMEWGFVKIHPLKSFILPINHLRIWIETERDMRGQWWELSLQQELLQEVRSANFSSASPSATPSMTSHFFVPRSRDVAQPCSRLPVKTSRSNKQTRCLFQSNISLSITKTNPFFQSISNVIAIVGTGNMCYTYKQL